MSKDPAVLFYTSDFLSGTAFFTNQQRGEYITLLCEQHQLWSIPEAHMVDVCGSINSPVVKKFSVDVDGTYYNKRMRDETVKRKSFCQSRRESIKKRYVRSTHVDTYVLRMENENENEDKDVIEVKKGDARGKSFDKPTIEEIKAYCLERANSIDAQNFFDFYESKGWMIGKNKMKNWQAAVRTWEKQNWSNGQTKKQYGRQSLTDSDINDVLNWRKKV